MKKLRNILESISTSGHVQPATIEITEQVKTTVVQNRESGELKTIESANLAQFPISEGWVEVGHGRCLKKFLKETFDSSKTHPKGNGKFVDWELFFLKNMKTGKSASCDKKNLSKYPEEDGWMIEKSVKSNAKPTKEDFVSSPATIDSLRRICKTSLNEEQTLDPVGAALIHLEDISVMTDDMSSTIGELDTIDLQIVDSLGKAYELLERIYDAVDDQFGISPANARWADQSDSLNDYEVFNSSEGEVGEVHEEAGFIATAKKHGFDKAPISAETYKPSASNKLKELYGIPMRAGKFADIFVGIFEGDKPFGVISEVGVNKYKDESDASNFLNFIIKKGVKNWDAYDEEVELNESFYRIPTKMVKNDLYVLAKDLESGVNELKKGNDFDYDRFNGYVLTLQRVLKAAKKFEKADDVDSTIYEELDRSKLRALANTGLVDPKLELPQLIKGLENLEAEKPLTPPQRLAMTSTLYKLISLVTGDTSVFNKVKSALTSSKNSSAQ